MDTGLGGRCFNTFIATTRASQEIDANLHDFSRGSLGGCDSTTVTTPSIDSEEIPAHGTLGVTDSANITVTGTDDWRVGRQRRVLHRWNADRVSGARDRGDGDAGGVGYGGPDRCG